jgi:hypothetical protein
MSQGLASFEKETPTGPVMLPAFYQKPKELPNIFGYSFLIGINVRESTPAESVRLNRQSSIVNFQLSLYAQATRHH